MDLKNYINTDNWFDYQDFYSMVAEKRFETLIEVGVWKGHSISYLAKKLKNENYKFNLFAVDLFDNSNIHKTIGNEHLSEQIPLLWQIYNQNLINEGVRDTINDVKQLSWEAAKLFDDNSVDFVFLDADHSYESVKKDIESWLPKIKKGGMISGHDYHNPCGVKKAVDELLPKKEITINNIWIYNIK
jgi:predicted O-methyltransferase YrrM